MANEEHVALLRQGVTVWNAWREEHREILPDLRYANLSGVDLSSADLSGVDLSSADLINVNLRYASLRSTKLIFTDLSGTNLINVDLRSADLSGAILRNAVLNGTDLSEAKLIRTHLSGASFYIANIAYTTFADVDLCAVERLDTVKHRGPSYVDVKTVLLPEGEARTHFLRGAGFSDTFIDYLPSLLTAAIQYASCFISYTHQDAALARRLYKDLQDKGVRCWFAPHDLRPGTLFHRGIEDAIHFHETVLLLLSQDAVQSNWVAHEVETTLNRQARERRDLLFPLRLDNAVMQATEEWAVRLRDSRHIGDFTGWQDDAIYQQHFAELLRHLKVKAL